jgi:hypothetical protein
MPPEVDQELRNFFREDIVKLQEYISRDLSAWLVGKRSEAPGSGPDL